MAKSETIGLIGIGLLGSAIAERLLQSGFAVLGFDPNADMKPFQSAGGQVASDNSTIASTCQRIILSLPDSNVVGSVIDQMRPALNSQTIVDTTTGSPDDTVAWSAELRRMGVDYLDSTVAGSSDMVRRHEATILVGGSKLAFERCEDVYSALSAKTFHVGESGSGARMKLVVNLAIGLNRAVLGEALAFGESLGFDSHQIVDVLINTPAHSDAMDTKGVEMATNDFKPQARLRQHLKDVRLILAAARNNQANVPLSKLHERLLQDLVDAGMGDLDSSAVINAFRPE